MQNTAIIPIFYLPPVSFFGLVAAHMPAILLEKKENFPKQTYRNRTTIASPNGSLDLIIPVVKGANNHTLSKDVKISYDEKWQRLHLLSIQTCYRSSAYFEFYEDGLVPFYEKKYNFLLDFNLELLTWLLKQLKLPAQLSFTDVYQKQVEIKDYRSSMDKNSMPLLPQKPYFQVFSDRNEFISNLSIVDLLFSQGPQAKNYF